MKINLKTGDIFTQYNDITNIDYFCRLYVTFIAHLLFLCHWTYFRDYLYMIDKTKIVIFNFKWIKNVKMKRKNKINNNEK